MTTGVAQSLGDRHRVAMPVRPALLQGDEGVNVMPAVGDRLAQTDDPVCLRAPFPVPVRVLDRAEGSLRLNEALVPMIDGMRRQVRDEFWHDRGKEAVVVGNSQSEKPIRDRSLISLLEPPDKIRESSGCLMIDVLQAAIRIVDPLEHSFGGRENRTSRSTAASGFADASSPVMVAKWR